MSGGWWPAFRATKGHAVLVGTRQPAGIYTVTDAVARCVLTCGITRGPGGDSFKVDRRPSRPERMYHLLSVIRHGNRAYARMTGTSWASWSFQRQVVEQWRL
jgi:hypothetical protein